MNRERTKSYWMLITAMLIFGTVGIFRRYIPLSSGLLSFVRGILGSMFLLILLYARGGRIDRSIGRRNLLLLAVTGALIGINWILLFEAYNRTTVSTATMCYYMEPTIVILLSPLVFREKLTARKLLCTAAAVVGMFLISGIADGGGIRTEELSGIFCGLGAAALYAAVVMLNKRIEAEDAYQKTAVQLASAAIVLLPYLLLTEDWSAVRLSTGSVCMVLLVGIVHTGLAYVLYFGSMKALPAQSIAVLSYIDPVCALLLSALVLEERLSVFGIIGAALIIGSALICELSRPARPAE